MGLQITFGDEYWATDKVNMTSNMRFAFSKNALTELDKTLFIIICTVTHSTGNHGSRFNVTGFGFEGLNNAEYDGGASFI